MIVSPSISKCISQDSRRLSVRAARIRLAPGTGERTEVRGKFFAQSPSVDFRTLTLPSPLGKRGDEMERQTQVLHITHQRNGERG
jgi:hypothetical protein